MSCESLESCGDSAQSEDLGEHFESELLKWTNFIYGWQERFFVLENRTLNYYKSKANAEYGSRGCLSLCNAQILTIDYDELRFDIQSRDYVWYLRAKSVEERNTWITHMKNAIIEAGYGSELVSIGKGSGSINSQTLSTTSLMENDILRENSNQLRTSFTRIMWQMELFSRLLLEAGDFSQQKEVNVELSNYRDNVAITSSQMTTCIDIIDKYEGYWRDKFDKERQKTRQLKKQLKSQRQLPIMESPDCPYQESEFFDAVDSAVDFLDSSDLIQNIAPLNSPYKCPYAKEIEDFLRCSSERWSLAKANAVPLTSPEKGMSLFSLPISQESGTNSFMLILRVKNFTAQEIARSFFDENERALWEDSVERTNILETYGEDTNVFYQIYHRIFPLSQRDLVSWSHITEVKEEGFSVWTVINHPCDHPTVPNPPGLMRAKAHMELVARTTVSDRKFSRREEIDTELSFISNVNLNGWISPHVVNALAQRMWPRGIRRFINHMNTHYNNDILL